MVVPITSPKLNSAFVANNPPTLEIIMSTDNKRFVINSSKNLRITTLL